MCDVESSSSDEGGVVGQESSSLWQQHTRMNNESNRQHTQECSDLQHRLVGHEGAQTEMLACKRLHERAAVEHAKKLQSQLNFIQVIFM